MTCPNILQYNIFEAVCFDRHSSRIRRALVAEPKFGKEARNNLNQVIGASQGERVIVH